MEKLSGESMDIVADNIAKLKELFPEILTENKIDFNTLKALLGEELDEAEERYSFTWHGKAQARRLAQTPSTGTLRPCKDESVDWDTTQNLFIEGDNLEVLKLLQKSYHKQVKMIYIDPPYNTGGDFVYPDDFRDNIHNYLEITGQVDSGKKLGTNTESSGRFHTDWLNMMYPRLKLARNLLADDGIIMISIDENEHVNLAKLCESIFGIENYCGEIIWKNSSKNDQNYISMQHEYFLVYVKNKQENLGDWIERKEGLEEIYKAFESFKIKHGNNWTLIHQAALDWFNSFPESNPIRQSKHYSWMDEVGVYFPSDLSGPNYGQYRYNLEHPITGQNCSEPASGWRYPEVTMLEKVKSKLIHFGVDHTTVPCNKTYLKDTECQSLTSIKFKDGRAASNRLKDLFGEKVFTNPKDELLLKDFFKAMGINNDDIVLDFFAGSASTSHALFELNKEQSSRCRTILVQLPEDLNRILAKATGSAKKVTQNAINYLKAKNLPENISEIAKERLRLLNKRNVVDHLYDCDLGFKVFKLDSSNLKPWDADFDSLATDLAESANILKTGRSNEDVLFEILLKYGLDLTLPIETHQLAGKTVYEVGAGALIVCLEDGITEAVAEAIGKLKETLAPEVMRVVFKDSSFANDAAKVNAVQVLKQFGIEDVKSI